MKTFLLLTCMYYYAYSFKVAIAGANGALGRELVYQSISRKWNVCAMTRMPTCTLFQPIRSGFFKENMFERIPMRDNCIEYSTYYKNNSFDALVIAVGGKPFKEDTSDKTVAKLCANLPSSCKKVCLVSAFGVGGSLDRAGIGIKAMESWYLRDAYSSKRRQEEVVSGINPSIDVLILRPRALTYACLPQNTFSISRKEIGEHILNWIGN